MSRRNLNTVRGCWSSKGLKELGRGPLQSYATFTYIHCIFFECILASRTWKSCHACILCRRLSRCFWVAFRILSTRTMMRMNRWWIGDEHEDAEDDNGTCGILWPVMLTSHGRLFQLPSHFGCSLLPAACCTRSWKNSNERTDIWAKVVKQSPVVAVVLVWFQTDNFSELLQIEKHIT